MTRKPTVSKGKRRSAARLAAVQALYQLELAGGVAETVVGEFNRYRFGGELDGQQLVEADPALFGELVLGVMQRRDEIDERLKSVLQGDWDFSSLELLIREILRAGAFEILMRPDIDPPLSISEYVDVAKAFFEKREPALINGILDRLARETRSGEMGGRSRDRTTEAQ
ncbi:MAG: transcription antitermination factor NusB [Alphaproteobacteria bacterium]